MKNESNSFLSNSIITLTRQVLGIIIGIILIIVVARALGPDGNGDYTMVTYVPLMLMTFLNLGINSSTVYFVSRKKMSINEAYSMNIIAAIALSIISIIIGAIILYFFSGAKIFNKIDPNLLYISLLSLPGIFLMTFLQTILQGMQHFKSYNTALVVQQMATLLSLILLLFIFPLGLMGTLLSFIIGYVCSVIYMVYFLIRYSEATFSFSYFSWGSMKEVLSYGIKAHVSNIMTFLNYRLGTFLLAYFLTNYAVGVYTVAVNVGERLSIFSQSISQVLLPRIASSNEEEDRNKITSMVSRFIMILVVVLAIIVFIFADWICHLLFGYKYPESPELLRWLLPGVTVLAVEKILSNDLAGRGKPELNMYVSFFNVAITLILNLILIPTIGVAGAAISSSITYIASFIIKCWIYKKETKMNFKDFLVISKSDFILIKKIYLNVKYKLATNK
jgi:O-antigen/teichoic acid export membrane protein